MNNGERIELVIFDLGRVLIRICDGWQHACEMVGLPRPASISDEHFAKFWEVLCSAEVGDIGIEEFAARAGPILGIPPEHVVKYWNAYLLGPYPGAVELVDELNRAGYQTACLSNTNVNHWAIMQDRGSASYLRLENLTHCFASHLVRMRKPEDRIYEHVERVTGIAPHKVIFFDDMPENIDAARKRGWNAYQIKIDSDPIKQVRSHLRAHGVAIAP
jgi:glucose-1-phosphatase